MRHFFEKQQKATVKLVLLYANDSAGITSREIRFNRGNIRIPKLHGHVTIGDDINRINYIIFKTNQYNREATIPFI